MFFALKRNDNDTRRFAEDKVQPTAFHSKVSNNLGSIKIHLLGLVGSSIHSPYQCRGKDMVSHVRGNIKMIKKCKGYVNGCKCKNCSKYRKALIKSCERKALK